MNAKPNDWSPEEMERAIRFYEQAPDGQWDELAAACIRQALVEYNLHN